jgi:hypothetical protein
MPYRWLSLPCSTFGRFSITEAVADTGCIVEPAADSDIDYLFEQAFGTSLKIALAASTDHRTDWVARSLATAASLAFLRASSLLYLLFDRDPG